MRRIGVLILIDEHRAIATPKLALHLRIMGEQRRSVDDLCVVSDTFGVENVEKNTAMAVTIDSALLLARVNRLVKHFAVRARRDRLACVGGSRGV